MSRRNPRSVANPEQALLLSVIIPCYNEALVITETVERLSAGLREAGVRHEFVLVNNNSKDSTESVLRDLAARIEGVCVVNTPPRPGYGVAVRCGLEQYAGDCAVIVMADGSETPADVLALYQPIRDGYDCGFGDRFIAHTAVIGYPRVKLACNRLGNWLIGVLLHSRYRDFTNGFKCYRRWVIDAMQPLVSEEFNLTIEMSMSAVLAGARYVVVPNDWRNRAAGKSKFALIRQSLLYLTTISTVLMRRFPRRRDECKGTVDAC